MTSRAVTLLLVEDDAIDLMVIKRALTKLKIDNPVVAASDGQEALDHLRGTNGYPKLARPCLVLLDLNMPRMNGIEFLDELRADPELRRTVVFAVSTSLAAEDRARVYDRNVAGYMLKHGPGDRSLEGLRMLEAFWRTVEFPD